MKMGWDTDWQNQAAIVHNQYKEGERRLWSNSPRIMSCVFYTTSPWPQWKVSEIRDRWDRHRLNCGVLRTQQLLDQAVYKYATVDVADVGLAWFVFVKGQIVSPSKCHYFVLFWKTSKHKKNIIRLQSERKRKREHIGPGKKKTLSGLFLW